MRRRSGTIADDAPDRVSSRLLLFVFDLLRHHGADPRALASDLVTIAGHDEVPAWVSWDDYITMIHRLGAVAGGAVGVAATMRATLDTAYDDLRAVAGFFAGPLPFLAFVHHHLNRELVPAARGEVEMLSPQRARIRYRIDAAHRPSRLYLEGTATIVEVFPCHFGLPEAQVDVRDMTDRTCELVAEFPATKHKVPWGTQLASPNGTLTHREQEVLRLVCEGLTNAQIASTLGTAASTVKSQISSILGKMDVANRTELAALASRRS